MRGPARCCTRGAPTDSQTSRNACPNPYALTGSTCPLLLPHPSLPPPSRFQHRHTARHSEFPSHPSNLPPIILTPFSNLRPTERRKHDRHQDIQTSRTSIPFCNPPAATPAVPCTPRICSSRACYFPLLLLRPPPLRAAASPNSATACTPARTTPQYRYQRSYSLPPQTATVDRV
jgi:hypothetical protein